MTNKKEEINFESALTELEKIVLKLEDDSINLEDLFFLDPLDLMAQKPIVPSSLVPNTCRFGS